MFQAPFDLVPHRLPTNDRRLTIGARRPALRLRHAILPAAIVCLALAAIAARGEDIPPPLRSALEARGEASREGFLRARGVLRGWWAHRDAKTGMLPRRLDQPVWAPQDNAADLFPFLLLTARFTDPERWDDVFSLFRIEIERTTRLGVLPDWYSIPEERFLHAEPDLRGIIFGAAEYAKDGLIPLVEVFGTGVWLDRMRELIDGIFEHAPVASDFGPLPADDGEVNGDVLQVLGRLHSLTREPRYLEWAVRIADAYCREAIPGSGGIPPGRWDFLRHRSIDDTLNLNDHGNEIVGGLAEAHAAAARFRPEKAAEWEPVLRRMFDLLLEKARNPDGLWFSRVRCRTMEVLDARTPDTWGYALTAVMTFGLTTGDAKFREAARTALSHLDRDPYRNWGDADSFADSIEGGLLLVNRFPETESSFLPWLDATRKGFYSLQRPDGVVEAWYGDGNFARTALMIALRETRGAWADPWRDDLRLGAVEDGKDIVHLLSVPSSGRPWSGRVHLDHPRHRDHLRLAADYPRLNQFPEWSTVESTKLYRVRAGEVEGTRLGAELIAGMPLSVEPGAPLLIRVTPLGDPPYGKPRRALRPALEEARARDPEVAAVAAAPAQEEYAGESYAWTARGPIDLAFDVPPGETGPFALWLRWGSKRDVRAGVVETGGRKIPVTAGGGDGFSWVRLELPPVEGAVSVRVSADPARGPAPFIAGGLLRRLRPGLEPDPAAETHVVEVEDLRGEWKDRSDLGGQSGRGYRTSGAPGISPEVLHGEVELGRAAEVAVWTRGWLGAGDRRFAVSIGGTALPPTHGSAAPEGFAWELAGIVALPAGRSALEVRDAGAGPEAADAVLLTSDLRFDPGLAERRIAPPIDGPAENALLVDRLIEECAARGAASHRALLPAEERGGAEWEEARGKLLSSLLSALGLDLLPDRTPLAARVIGETARDGYRVERLVYESRPGFPVTANVYLPADRGLADGQGRLPAVICPIGHWKLSKAEPVVQARCAFLARRGFLVLVYDPFGQGEREVSGNGHDESFRGAPAGLINLSFMVWDTMRGIDYLLERGDVDPARIGCTGASGGGLNTLYAAAVDGRIRAAVPAVYLTTFEEFLKTRIEHCPCSHVPGILRFADMGDALALLAPRPALLLAARADPMFTVPGAKAAREEALPAWRAAGKEDDLRLLEFDGPHDYNQAMREAMVGFLEKHLLGRGNGSPVPEPSFAPEPPDSPVLRCFPEGKVPASAATVASISIAEGRRLAAALSAEPAPEVRDRLAALLGWEGPPAVERVERPEPADPGLPESILLRTEGALVPALRWARRGSTASVILVSTEGAARAMRSALFTALRKGPFDVVAVDLPGWGSTAGQEHLLHTDALLLGKPMVARRARALLAMARAVSAARRAGEAARAAAGSLDLPGGDASSPSARPAPVPRGKVLFAAEGAAAGVTALVAAALAPRPIPLAARGLPGSIVRVLEAGPSPEIAAFGLLRVADVPQLARLDGGKVRAVAAGAGAPDLEDLVRWLEEQAAD